MGKKKDTIRAARQETSRSATGKPGETQGRLADRYIRTHTPERRYPRPDDWDSDWYDDGEE
ncbi:hypothetical protein FM076_02480 [Streptomyces albus subsp. chlorinus]|uniref:hypothetical protein n=1 Tax=Streptomyces albus TaxID=1888 RepID=UPI0015714649|nr:hypothetical protein [Streptomyces albus]NSC20135.1 hypothetical protein [Streptomyces albus subsp. chlorinus]